MRTLRPADLALKRISRGINVIRAYQCEVTGKATLRIGLRRRQFDRGPLAVHDFQQAVIITVIVMRMMQMPIDEIVDMITMRDGFVAAAWSVNVAWLKTGTAMLRHAPIRVCRGDLDHMLVDMAGMRMMKVTVMKVIDVIAMAH